MADLIFSDAGISKDSAAAETTLPGDRVEYGSGIDASNGKSEIRRRGSWRTVLHDNQIDVEDSHVTKTIVHVFLCLAACFSRM